MANLFPQWVTPAARATLVSAMLLVVAIPAAFIGWVRTPRARGEHLMIAQPVPFDHRIHAFALRIDCRFCHTGVERSAWAGVPSTQQCVPCHSNVWLSSREFAPVRLSLATGRPIPWARVTQLPDFVYFNHAIHVRKGVGCETCHGRVDRMGVVQQVVPLTMSWCVDCHRDPVPAIRPLDAVATMGWHRSDAPGTSGTVLAARYNVHRLTNCTTCHR
ncbi:MAG: cytochrome c3 family protein [Gemmatimonadaceae bacterium]